MLCRVAPRMWYIMYIQNLAHTRPSINRSCSCQKYLSLVHTCLFSDPQIIAPSHKAQHYIKALLNSQKWANLRETAERNSPTFKVNAHPNPHQKPGQTAPRMSRKEAREAEPSQPMLLLPSGWLAASPCRLLWGLTRISLPQPKGPQWGQKCPAVARPSLSYCCNYSPTADSRILCSWIQGICYKTLEPGGN